MLLPFQGALLQILITQGDALSYMLVSPSGRKVRNNCTSYFLHITKTHKINTIHSYIPYKNMCVFEFNSIILFMEQLYSDINNAIEKDGLSYELLLSFW